MKSNYINNETYFMDTDDLSNISHNSTGNVDTHETRLRYMISYFVLVALSVGFFLCHSFAFFRICLIASKNLHDKLFDGVINATMHFFNTNSSGRLLNRFSSDIKSIDTLIPPAMSDVIRVNKHQLK